MVLLQWLQVMSGTLISIMLGSFDGRSMDVPMVGGSSASLGARVARERLTFP
jgi:hypothetical protein